MMRDPDKYCGRSLERKVIALPECCLKELGCTINKALFVGSSIRVQDKSVGGKVL